MLQIQVIGKYCLNQYCREYFHKKKSSTVAMLRNKSLKQTCTNKDKISNHDWLRSRVMWLYSALDQCLDNFPTTSNNQRPRKIDPNYIIFLLSCRFHYTCNTADSYTGTSAELGQFTHSTFKYYYPCTLFKFISELIQ